MPITKLTNDLNIVQALSDLPNDIEGLTAAQLKAKFDEAAGLIKTYLNNTLVAELEAVTGASNIGATAITDLDGATVQAILASIRNKLKAITAGASGADFVKATGINGLTGDTVQALLSSIKTYIDTHKSSGDHDGRYFTETELQTTSSGSSGATKIGATEVYVGSGTTVQAILEWLYDQIANVTVGQIADGSLTDVKLSNDVGQIKERFTSHVADYVRQTGYGTTAGVANAYTLTLSPVLTSYTAGTAISILIHATNTGASTINVNGLGVKPLKKSDGMDFSENDLLINSVYPFRYNGINFIIQSEREVMVNGQTEEILEFAETISIYDPVYVVPGDSVAKLADPATLPTNISYGVAFSPDGVYMSVAHNTTPFITIYKRSGDAFTKLANPAILPANTGNGVAFSPDGVHMSVAHYDTPFITIYKRSGDAFTKLANPATLPTGVGKSVAFSPDGVHMSVGHDISPFITIYKRSGDTFTKLADPATLPPRTGSGVAFSPDGVYMTVLDAIPIGTTITIYKRSGDAFTKLADPATLPPSSSYGVAFSPDGVHMSVAHYDTPFITIYKRSGDTFTKLANPAILPAETGNGVAFSADGAYMTVAHFNTPFITIYKRSGDAFTKLANPATLPTGTGRGVAFSADGSYMSVAHNTTPFITIYKYGFSVFKSGLVREWPTANKLGYAKESGVAGNLKKVIITHR